MTLNETTVAVWEKAESEVVFAPELSKENAHARRAPYRVIPSDHGVSLNVDPAAFDAVLRVYPNALEVGTIRGEYSKHIKWSIFSAYFMWAFGAFTFAIMILSVWGGRRRIRFLIYVFLAHLDSFPISCFVLDFIFGDQRKLTPWMILLCLTGSPDWLAFSPM